MFYTANSGYVEVALAGVVGQCRLAVGLAQVGRGGGAHDGRVAGDAVRRQVRHLLGDVVRVLGRSQVGRQAPAALVEAHQHEDGEHDDGSETVAAQHRSRSCTNT